MQCKGTYVLITILITFDYCNPKKYVKSRVSELFWGPRGRRFKSCYSDCKVLDYSRTFCCTASFCIASKMGTESFNQEQGQFVPQF